MFLEKKLRKKNDLSKVTTTKTHLQSKSGYRHKVVERKSSHILHICFYIFYKKTNENIT